MNPIDRATAQLKKLSPVWEFKIKESFEVGKPYRIVETNIHYLIIRPKIERTFRDKLSGLLKPFENEYGIELGRNEEIERAILKEKYIYTSYLYYDDPEETEADRRKYIESLKIYKPGLKLFPNGSDAKLERVKKEIIAIKRIKNERPFDYQPNSIK